jgi:hypothetical protein
MVTPEKIKTFYNVDDMGGGSESQEQVIFSTLTSVANAPDLAEFQTHFNLPQTKIAKDTGDHVEQEGHTHDKNDYLEPNLDVQYMMAMAPKTPLTHWWVSDEGQYGSYGIHQACCCNEPPTSSCVFVLRRF